MASHGAPASRSGPGVWGRLARRRDGRRRDGRRRMFGAPRAADPDRRSTAGAADRERRATTGVADRERRATTGVADRDRRATTAGAGAGCRDLLIQVSTGDAVLVAADRQVVMMADRRRAARGKMRGAVVQVDNGQRATTTVVLDPAAVALRRRGFVLDRVGEVDQILRNGVGTAGSCRGGERNVAVLTVLPTGGRSRSTVDLWERPGGVRRNDRAVKGRVVGAKSASSTVELCAPEHPDVRNRAVQFRARAGQFTVTVSGGRRSYRVGDLMLRALATGPGAPMGRDVRAQLHRRARVRPVLASRQEAGVSPREMGAMVVGVKRCSDHGIRWNRIGKLPFRGEVAVLPAPRSGVRSRIGPVYSSLPIGQADRRGRRRGSPIRARVSTGAGGAVSPGREAGLSARISPGEELSARRPRSTRSGNGRSKRCGSSTTMLRVVLSTMVGA